MADTKLYPGDSGKASGTSGALCRIENSEGDSMSEVAFEAGSKDPLSGRVIAQYKHVFEHENMEEEFPGSMSDTHGGDSPKKPRSPEY